MSTNSRGFLLLCAVVVAPLPGWAEEIPHESEPWTAAHEEGLELYESGEFRSAAVAFERADQLGAPPPNLYNLARSYQQSGQLRRAIEVFDRYLNAAEIPEERRERARAHRGEAQSQMARIEVRTDPPGAMVIVDGHDDLGGPSPVLMLVDPGSYSVEASLPDHDLSRTTVNVIAGAHQVVTLALPSRQAGATEPDVTQPPADIPVASERWRGGPWLVFGAGLGIALTGVALWATAYVGSQRDERFDSVESYDQWQYQLYDLALAGDILVGVGAAAVVAGLIWLTIDRLRRRQRHSDRPRASAQIAF